MRMFIKTNEFDKLSRRYACIKCGTWVSIKAQSCKQCQHSFTDNDKSSMQTLYNQNKEQNWQHTILPIIFVILVIALLLI
ncbi:hypothetical protein [Pseudoalteromonas sp. TAB23]|uniref:hypothetical protein n=1 Tax=Pseudoalteromonas sp. TAB23 TaxID=1938595 RepID=UPI000464DD65|nr:hypothetical protein [Pseudoalteromonas sp. TAB23]